jgi:hypothetical protein
MSDATTRLAWLYALDDPAGSRFSAGRLQQFHPGRDPQLECHAFVAGQGAASPLPVRSARLATDAAFQEILSTYDAAIFNIGSVGQGADAILQTLRRLPGVLILHEDSCQGVFAARCFGALQSPGAFARLIHRYYGTSGLDALLTSGASAASFPLLEPIAALASALVVHSDAMETCVRSFFHGPVLRLQAPGGDSDNDQSRNYLAGLTAFIRENRDLLRRRARFVAPVRDALAQPDPERQDEPWWESLLGARAAHNDLERDPDVRSPEPFLKWSERDIAKLVAWFFLDSPEPAQLEKQVRSIIQCAADRWQVYVLVATLRRLQELCLGERISPDDLAIPAARILGTDFWALACHLRPAVFARLLYVAILQRPWEQGEPDRWAQLVESGMPPIEMFRRFVATAGEGELAANDRLALWADEQVLVQSLRRGDDVPSWQPGNRVHFSAASSAAAPRLVGNWHGAEAVGRWTHGRSGALAFRLPANAAPALTLTLRLRVAGTEQTGSRKIVAYCDGQKVASLDLANDSPCDWSISLNAAPESSVVVALIADRSFSPASAGVSGDTRDLGIMLIEAVLVSAPGNAEAEPPEGTGASVSP